MSAAYFFVEVIEATGKARGVAFRFVSREQAIRACDEIQSELDDDDDTARCFVFDRFGVPIACGREHTASRNARRPGVA